MTVLLLALCILLISYITFRQPILDYCKPLRKRFTKTHTVRPPFDFQVIIPSGVCQTVSIIDQHLSDPLPVGWALISVDKEGEYSTCTVWDILIREEYRRKGYGLALMRLLQETFDELFTQWNAALINSAGVQLCLKAGFHPQKALFKKDVGTLVWRKYMKRTK
jgi:GNAT superfamily N-acetyltransferase